MGVPHLPLDLSLGNQGRHGVDDDDVQTARTHEHVSDLQGLFTGVRLGDQKIVDVDAQSLGINRVKGVLGIDEGGIAAGPLRTGHSVQGNSGLSGGLRPVDLDDATSRKPSDPQGHIKSNRARGDDGHRRTGIVPQTHDGALTEVLVDLGEGSGQGLGTVLGLAGSRHLFYLGSRGGSQPRRT